MQVVDSILRFRSTANRGPSSRKHLFLSRAARGYIAEKFVRVDGIMSDNCRLQFHDDHPYRVEMQEPSDQIRGLFET